MKPQHTLIALGVFLLFSGVIAERAYVRNRALDQEESANEKSTTIVKSMDDDLDELTRKKKVGQKPNDSGFYNYYPDQGFNNPKPYPQQPMPGPTPTYPTGGVPLKCTCSPVGQTTPTTPTKPNYPNPSVPSYPSYPSPQYPSPQYPSTQYPIQNYPQFQPHPQFPYNPFSFLGGGYNYPNPYFYGFNC